MKRSFSLSIVLLYFVFSSFGQEVMTYESNAFLHGDQHKYLLIANLEEINEGIGGTNITWDYTHLIPGDTLISYMLDATQQQDYEHFPETNIVIREDEKINFFHVSPNGIDEYGFIRGENIYRFDLPIKRFSFPFEYGKKNEGSYTRELLGFPDSKITGTYNTEIDGFGTLILPGDITIKNVLRVKTSQILDNTQTGFITYRWYSLYSDPVLRYPLFSIIKRESSTKSYVRKAAYYINADQLVEKSPIFLGSFTPQEFISQEASMLKIKAYPNPFIEKITVDYVLPEEAKVTILVADGLGRLVDTLVDKKQKAGFHTVEFKGKGYFFVYYVTTLINGRVVSSKKMIHVNR